MFFKTEFVNFVCDIQNALSIVSSNRVQDIQWVNSDVNLGILKSNECIVKEHIEPLLIETLFLLDEECMTSIHNLIKMEMLLERLDNFDSQL